MNSFLKPILNVSGGTYLEKDRVSLWDSHTDPRDRESINESFYQRSISCIKTLEEDTNLRAGDFLVTFIQKWSSRELLQLKKLHREGIRIIIWFANEEKETAAPYLKEGFAGYLPHDFKKEELIGAIEGIESEDCYIHKDLVNVLHSDFVKKISI